MRRDDVNNWFDANDDEWEQVIAAQEQAMRQNPILVEEMVDAIVGGSTRRSYFDDNMKFIKWAQANKPGWVTDYGTAQIDLLHEESDGMPSRRKNKYVREGLKRLLHDATLHPLVDLLAITPQGFMEYIDQCRNKKTGRRLSKSADGNRRSAFFDLFRWHDRTTGGYPENFKRELTGLYKGFFRILTQRRT